MINIYNHEISAQGESEFSSRTYEGFTGFCEQDIALIKQADTVFIASSEEQNGNLDASQRGGKSGFVHINDKNLFLLSGKARIRNEGKGESRKFLPRRIYFSLDKGLRVKPGIQGQWSCVEN